VNTCIPLHAWGSQSGARKVGASPDCCRQSYANHFAWHEGQHIKIAKSYEAKLERRLDGASCSAADSIIKRVGRNMNAAQDKFDAKDFAWQPLTAVPYTGPQS
jgi:hypothetical protein